MLDSLIQFDKQAFMWINRSIENGFFDSVLPWMRNEYTWLPLYVVILLWAVIKFKGRGGLWSLWCIATVVLSDVTSSHLIKKTVCRPRPCHIPEELTDIVVRISCGTGYSFTSSHATNHMAMAVFIITTGMMLFGKWRWLFLPWAILIGFAQIYVGVHYPFDVLAGFLLGATIAMSTAMIYGKTKFVLVSKPSSISVSK